MTLSHVSAHWFSKRVLAWHASFGRVDLPWKTRDPYRVWLSEIMLQQTQVATVIPYFERFVARFPTVEHLAQASLEHVLQHWAGLGYYARARNLHRTAQAVVTSHQGCFPKDIESLVALPGIGLSTAGALVAQAYEIRAPILDGNVKRVLSRFHCVAGQTQNSLVLERLWALADYYTPKAQVGDYTQAIMDIGATLCTRTRPQCTACPLQARCLAYQQDDPLRYPEKPPKKKIPKRQTTVMVLRNPRGDYLLIERPPRGIWGGLWSLPEFETLDLAKTFIKKHWGAIAPKSWQRQPLVDHAFTHYKLTIHPYALQLPTHKTPKIPQEKVAWYAPHQLTDIGLPAPIKKILNHTEKN